MTAALLVPRRSDGGERDTLWRFCRARWQDFAPHVEIVEGFDSGEGPFNRAAAVNNAARSTTADVLVMCDCDVFTAGVDQLDILIDVTRSTGRFTVGFHRTIKLDPTGTERVLRGWKPGWDKCVESRPEFDAGAFVAVTRSLFDEVNGFDESFTGWGWEDVALRVACETLAGPRVTLAGDIYHLHHGRSPNHDEENEANRQRHLAYVKAMGDPEAMRELVAR